MRIQWKDGCLQSQKRVLPKNWIYWTLTLDFPDFRTMRNKHCWSQPVYGILLRQPRLSKATCNWALYYFFHILLVKAVTSQATFKGRKCRLNLFMESAATTKKCVSIFNSPSLVEIAQGLTLALALGVVMSESFTKLEFLRMTLSPKTSEL